MKIFALAAMVVWGYGAWAQNPALDWARQLGGDEQAEGNAIAVDAAGNVYTTGRFSETVDFDPGPGVHHLNAIGAEDIYVSKLDPNGNFAWARRAGGIDFINGYANNGVDIGVDGAGNVYTVGTFVGTADFDPGPSFYNLNFTGTEDNFIWKLDAAGNLIWAKQISGPAPDGVLALQVDGTGNLYLTGEFRDTVDFDPGPGVVELASTTPNSYDVFVCKLDSGGNLLWARSMGGTVYDLGASIAVDDAANVYLTGQFRTTMDFDPGPATFNLTAAANIDCFVMKLDANGNFAWANQIGGTQDARGTGIAVDGAGNSYSIGTFLGTADFDPGPGTFTLSNPMFNDVFVRKLDPGGNLVWAKQVAAVDDMVLGKSIALDHAGNAYFIGIYHDTTDFDPGPGDYPLTANGSWDNFVVKLDASGNFAWAIGAGGPGNETINAITLDAASKVYTTGYFGDSVDFDPGAGIFHLHAGPTNQHAFVYKLNQGGVGRTEVAGEHPVWVHPNPGNGHYTLEWDGPHPQATVVLTDAMGRILGTYPYVNAQKVQFELDGPAGIYFVTVRTREGSAVVRVVKTP